MEIKKLIEVGLPLEEINRECAREKSIHTGHPSSIHLWWARRPTAAARAVIWSSLVDDPSSHPEKFPTEKEQNEERQRLFSILKKLVLWDNSNDEELLKAAREEIIKSTNGNPPELLDPFSGGGTIPLEGQRLGLKVHAHDLNPVALLINKATVEFPYCFANMPPVNPQRKKNNYSAAQGIAEDIRYYGNLLKEKAFERIGYLYPQMKIPDNLGGGYGTPMAWIWTNTVKCPNPECGCEAPLASSFILSEHKNNKWYAKPIFSDNKFIYEVKQGDGVDNAPKIGRGKFKCIHCGIDLPLTYIKEEGMNNRIGRSLIAIVVNSDNGKIYLPANDEQLSLANVTEPEDLPDTPLDSTKNVQVPSYGINQIKRLFTNRQLTAISTLARLIPEIRQIIKKDAIAVGLDDDNISINNNGRGAQAYSEVLSVYLAFAIDKNVDYNCILNRWSKDQQKAKNLFCRQALTFIWDFAESNPFSNNYGSYNTAINYIANCINRLPATQKADVQQFDAQEDCGLRNIMISTDPPYYDNIDYSALSDVYYYWLRISLNDIFPDLLKSKLTPKVNELTAFSYRHKNKQEAKNFFENGMFTTCKQFYNYTRNDIPITIYYAYKYGTGKEKETFFSWEAMLNAIISAGFKITNTILLKTENKDRMVGLRKNILNSSTVLVCRKQTEDAPETTKLNFINEFNNEMVNQLQRSNIIPVDLGQFAIGIGISIYCRYSKIIDENGNGASIHDILEIINEEIKNYFNKKKFDEISNACIDIYKMYGFKEFKENGVDYSNIENLIAKQDNKIKLLKGNEIKDNKSNWSIAQQLTYGINNNKNIEIIKGADYERIKDLIYCLYEMSIQKNLLNEAYEYNEVIVNWETIVNKIKEN